jgi:hypothetical protein
MPSSTEDPLQAVLVHGAISVIMASCFSLTLAVFGSDALPLLFPLSPFGLAAPALAAAAAVLLSVVLERERALAAAFIRGAVLMLIVFWPLQALLLPRQGGISFLPDPPGVFCVLDCALSFTLASLFRGFFRAREFFAESTRGLEGEKLRNMVRDEGYLLTSTRQEMELAMATATVLIGALGLLLLVLFWGKGSLSPALTACYGASAVAFVFLRAVITDFLSSQSLAGIGIAQAPGERAGRIRLALAAAAGLAVLSFALTGDESPLSIELVLRALASFFSLLGWGPARVIPQDPQELERLRLSRLELSDADFGEPLIDLGMILDFLKKAAIVAAAAAFLWFLLKPIFSARLKDFVKARKPLKALGRFFDFLKRVLGLLSGRKAARTALSAQERKKLERDFENVARKAKSIEKERETGRMAKAFIELIALGTGLGLPYRPTSVPLEWTKALQGLLPAEGPEDRDLSARLIAAAGIFEEALYSDRILGREKTDPFFGALKAARERWR